MFWSLDQASCLIRVIFRKYDIPGTDFNLMNMAAYLNLTKNNDLQRKSFKCSLMVA